MTKHNKQLELCEICQKDQATYELPLQESQDGYVNVPTCERCWDAYMVREGMEYYDE